MYPLAIKLEAAREFAKRVASNARDHALAQGMVQALEDVQAKAFTIEDGLIDASLEMQALVVMAGADDAALYQQIGRYAGFLFAESDDYQNAKQQALREYLILCEMKADGAIDSI